MVCGIMGTSEVMNVQTIILVEDMACEHCAAKIDHALAETSIHYTVDLPRKAVIVEGTQDDVMKARAVIDEIGFTVK